MHAELRGWWKINISSCIFWLGLTTNLSQKLDRSFRNHGKSCVWKNYASVNSSSAHAPPPRANPRALAFFLKKWGNSPGWGHISCLNAPGWGRTKRENAPPLVSSPSNTLQIFINQWIKRSIVQYFSTTALKTSRTTVRASSSLILIIL